MTDAPTTRPFKMDRAFIAGRTDPGQRTRLCGTEEMWKRFAAWLCCPMCGGSLSLSIRDASSVKLEEQYLALAEAHDLLADDFNVAVRTAVLLCPPCRSWFPVINGLPVLLPYRTPAHIDFGRAFSAEIPAGYGVAAAQPMPGEELVMKSFSAEWGAYDYDGVIWEMSYEDHEERFLLELGPAARDVVGPFLELGCGLGVTTALSFKNFRTDSVGVDVSLAAMRANEQYRENPFLHFVQGSVFYLPFRPGTFGIVYSRGVLHHTYSTERAFNALARYCAPDGLLYVWVYGPGSVNETLFRRAAYVAERGMRWMLNHGVPLNWTLSAISIAYIGFNRIRRLQNPQIQSYNYSRALHAARDRFTPRFAHRQDHSEVQAWFKKAGYDAEVVNWQTMPPVDHDDYRRNTGVRGRRRQEVVGSK